MQRLMSFLKESMVRMTEGPTGRINASPEWAKAGANELL
jgi:hypothetical protein